MIFDSVRMTHFKKFCILEFNMFDRSFCLHLTKKQYDEFCLFCKKNHIGILEVIE